jgi:serine/threonine protein kinase
VTAFVADLGRTIPVKWATDVPVQGNSNYAAPETIYREKMKGAHYYKSDIFALGCVFWQLYFGKLPEWCSSDTWKNEAISKKDRYQAKVYLINAIRGHYKAKLEKRMKKDHKLTPRQKFLGLILEMTDPVPEKRGETKVLYIKLHTIVYGKAPEVKAEGKPSPQGKVETNETQSHGSHGHSRHEKVHTK